MKLDQELRRLRRELEAEYGRLSDHQWEYILGESNNDIGYEDYTTEQVLEDVRASAVHLLRFQALGRQAGEARSGRRVRQTRRRLPGKYAKPAREREDILKLVLIARDYGGMPGDPWPKLAGPWGKASGSSGTPEAFRRRYYAAVRERGLSHAQFAGFRRFLREGREAGLRLDHLCAAVSYLIDVGDLGCVNPIAVAKMLAADPDFYRAVTTPPPASMRGGVFPSSADAVRQSPPIPLPPGDVSV